MFISNTVSSNIRAFAKGVPGANVSCRIIRPEDSLARPSSTSEQSIPSETSPLILLFNILVPLGRCAPGRASGTRSPSFIFLAPQTIAWVLSPVLTEQSVSLSALGWGFIESIRATTTLSSPFPSLEIPSTSRPAVISVSASLSGEMSMSTKSLSQFRDIFIILKS